MKRSKEAPVSIAMTVRNFLPSDCPTVPVWTGVALPPGAVSDAASLRLADAAGSALPAQFDVLARWADGSIRWVLASWFAAPGAAGADGPSDEQFVLTAGAAAEAPAPPHPAVVGPDTHRYEVNTGPLAFYLSRHGFAGLTEVRLDVDGEGQLPANDYVCDESPDSGIVAVDADGVAHTSQLGRVERVEVELPGPIHACVAVHGDLRSQRGAEALLRYCLRVHAFAGSTLVRMVLTVHNPRPTGRAGDGARLVLGQSGAVLLRELTYALRARLPFGRRTVTLSPEPGSMHDRIPLTAALGVYQDSSGGENWFHRTHVNRDNVIPLSFRGYRVDYDGRGIAAGLRAEPWLEVADMRWAVALAAPGFWQNFPKSLGADADGTVRLGLWPGQFADLHEIQGGEQKTHEFYVYFRHRRRGRDESPAPYAREVMPVCLRRPSALASAESYARSGAIDAMVPAAAGAFAEYEAVAAAAVRGTVNLFTHREEADEYGWRHFGDTPAYNEGDRTRGPYDGLRVVSHYNNEYDLGLTMLAQAVRTFDAEASLSDGWWRLGLEALWHEADIDVYHTTDDPAPIYNGGTFTHTGHGVDAGRSTHRAGPRDEHWGILDWPWGRGSTPESGHVRTRGIVLAYLLTGDRHLLDVSWEVAGLIAWKIEQDRFAQIDVPNRSAGHNLQVLQDAWTLSWDERYLALCRKIVENLRIEAVTGRLGRGPGADWSCDIYTRNLGRFIDELAAAGLPDEGAVESFLEYARAIVAHRPAAGHRRRRGGWSLLRSEVLAQAAELAGEAQERAAFEAAAQEAFGTVGRSVGPDGAGVFRNSKQTTIQLHGGGRYMRYVTDKPADPPGKE